MKILFLLFCVLSSFILYCQEVSETNSSLVLKDSVYDALSLKGMIQLTNIGFAPVPSFSFNKPVAMVFLSISKGKTSYEPAWSLGLNGKPWIMENWVRYKFFQHKSFSISAGINPSLFFKSESSSSKKEIIKANRNLTCGLFANAWFSRAWSVKLTYWYNKRFDSGTISGHFIDMAHSFSNISLSKELFINLKSEIFYFNNVGRVDGLFTSGSISAAGKKWPLSLYLQGVQPLWTNFENAGFKWNVGLVYFFHDRKKGN